MELGKVNCGALTSNITITPVGDIKLCTMDNLTYMDSWFGNVFDTNIKVLYENHFEIINSLQVTESPKSNSEECIECDHRFFCGNCLLRGVIKSKEMGAACKWYTNKVPQTLKNTLLSYQEQVNV